MDLDKYFNDLNNYALETKHNINRTIDASGNVLLIGKRGQIVKFMKYTEHIYIIAIFTCSEVVDEKKCSLFKVLSNSNPEELTPLFTGKSSYDGGFKNPLPELPYDDVAYHYFYKNPQDNKYYFQNKYLLSTVLNMKPIANVTNSAVSIKEGDSRILNYSIRNKQNRCALESILSLYRCYPSVMSSLIKDKYRDPFDEYVPTITVSTDPKIKKQDIPDDFLKSMEVTTDMFEHTRKLINDYTYYRYSYDNYPVNVLCTSQYGLNLLFSKLFYEKENTITNPYDDNLWFRKVKGKSGNEWYIKHYPYGTDILSEEDAKLTMPMFSINKDNTIMLPNVSSSTGVDDIITRPFIKYNKSYALISLGDIRLVNEDLYYNVFDANTPKQRIKKVIIDLLKGGTNEYANKIKNCLNIPKCLENESFEVLGGTGYSVNRSAFESYTSNLLGGLNHYITFICDPKTEGIYFIDSITDMSNSDDTYYGRNIDDAGILPMAFLIQFTGYNA